ncbi:outer membrane efflux protein [Anaerotignum neopropionicum]|uniref:Outer membrane efflux protein n=1 Tax=Anaerotignum neopropionicum TaxID=36847 RepID=A0A136WEY2_9FIRM|nr:TolC family protein [Anaerotignum neopropionicum]KXL52899.1 outer membrane efflux protein [Anaerotignum neopropionicum]
MAKFKYQKSGALLLAGVLTFSVALPAYAKTTDQKSETIQEETAQESVVKSMTLEEIQKEVLKNNRIQTTLTLNYKKVLSGLDAINDGLDDLQNAQDSAANARKSAGSSSSTGKSALEGAVTGDTLSGNTLGYTDQALVGISSGLLSGSSKIASAMEDMTDSIVDTQRNTLEDQQQDLNNTKLDLNKTKEDWNNQALLVSQLLVEKTVHVKEGIELLEKKLELMERLYLIEEKKSTLGLGISTDLAQAKLAISQNKKDIADAKNGLILLKRQLNDLMGKPIDDPLEVEAPELTRVIEYAPEYSDELLKEATDKNYQLKTLRRDYQQAEKKSKDTTLYSGQIKMHETDMDIAKVAMETQKITIANNLKKKLDSIDKAASAYQLQKDTYEKAKTQWEQQQKSAKLGLISAVELQALELQFLQIELVKLQAAYDYDLAWEEYRLLMDGTSLDIYDTYKEQIG